MTYWLLWGLFGSSFISSTLLPGGSELALLLLIKQGDYSPWLLFFTALAGNTLGAWLTFAMGWLISIKYPAKTFEKRWQQKALSWLQQRGKWALLFSWLPLLGDPLCLMAGWLRLNIYTCALCILFGKALRYAFIVYLAG